MARRTLFAMLRQPGGGRRSLGLLLALALAVRLLVPQGWMPDRAGGLMLCPEAGPVLAAAGGHHGKHHEPGKQAPDQPCAFAGLGLAVAPPPLVPVVLPPSPMTAAPGTMAGSVAIGRGLAAPPPPATGPPAFA